MTEERLKQIEVGFCVLSSGRQCGCCAWDLLEEVRRLQDWKDKNEVIRSSVDRIQLKIQWRLKEENAALRAENESLRLATGMDIAIEQVALLRNLLREARPWFAALKDTLGAECSIASRIDACLGQAQVTLKKSTLVDAAKPSPR